MSKAANPGDNAQDAVVGLSYSQVLAAGLASAGAAVLTSRFGVTGTLLGAALTTMIITGGSVVLKNYLEKMSGHVQSIGARRNRRASKAPRNSRPETVAPPISGETSGGMAVYGRRRRSLFGGMKRRSVLVGALIPALLAFGIAIAAVTGVELTGGRTLSCLVWDECGVASADGTSEGSRTSLGVFTGDSSRSGSVENSRDSQQAPTQDSGIFGNDGSNSGMPPQDEVVPVTPGGSGDSDYDTGTPGTGTPGTGTGVEPGTGVPEEEVPDYETPPTDSSGGMDQTPTETPAAPSSRSSDAPAATE